MKYLKYLLTFIFLLLIFGGGVIAGYLIPQYGNIGEYEKGIPTQMRLCNATDTDFQYVRANRSSFTELKAGDCSEYRQTFDLHKNTSVEVYTGENENIRNLYTYRPTDLVGTPRLVFGKHTIYIRELRNTERKIIEHRYGVDFDIK